MYGDAKIIKNYGLWRNEKKCPEAIISFKYSCIQDYLIEWILQCSQKQTM